MSTKENLKSRVSWMRGLYILLFALLYGIAEFVLWAIVLFQFGSQLITARPNARLLEFCHGLNAYIYQILQFITYRSDEKPYPFAEWPAAGLDAVRETQAMDEAMEETGGDGETEPK